MIRLNVVKLMGNGRPELSFPQPGVVSTGQPCKVSFVELQLQCAMMPITPTGRVQQYRFLANARTLRSGYDKDRLRSFS